MSVNISYLPPKGSPEAERLIREYPTASQEQLEAWAKQYGYKGVGGFQQAIWRRFGVHRATPENLTREIIKTEPEIVYKPYPDFKLKSFLASKSRSKEEVVIVLTDHHIGRKTENYNIDIYIKRMETLLESVMKIINLHRPVGKAYIFALGDMVQGEDVHKGANVDETSCGVWSQINDYAIPILSRFMLSLLPGVEGIEFYGVRGNHGIYGKESTPQTNWDNFVYKGLEVALADQKQIKVHCPTEFYQLVDIKGFKFFLIHGDQAKSSQGIPLFALRRKFQDWYAYVGGFDYAYCGHWHTWGADAINSYADYQICPPLVTGDKWALERVGRASKPIQLIHGVHPRHGRTWEYKLLTDNAFSIKVNNDKV